MDQREIQARFDEGTTKLFTGDFASAAEVFERIIEFCSDLHVRQVAGMYLRWCFPMQQLLGYIGKSDSPVPLEELYRQLHLATDWAAAGHDRYTSDLIKLLHGIPSIVRYSESYWISVDALLSEAERVIVETRGLLPFTLTEFCSQLFPGCFYPPSASYNPPRPEDDSPSQQLAPLRRHSLFQQSLKPLFRNITRASSVSAGLWHSEAVKNRMTRYAELPDDS